MVFLFLNSCASSQTPINNSPYNNVPAPDLSVYYQDVHVPSNDGGTFPMSNPTNGEIIIPIQRNQPAPFNGVLLNGAAIAFIETEFRGQQTQCTIERQADISRLAARAIADINNLQLTINTNQRTYQVLLNGRDADIQSLMRTHRNQELTNSLLWGLGGVVLGVGITGAIVWAAH